MESVINFEKNQGSLTANFWQIKKINAFPIQNRMRVLFSGFTTQIAAESAPESELTTEDMSMEYFKTETEMIEKAQNILDSRAEAVDAINNES